MKGKLYIGDIGTSILVEVGIDLTAATGHSISVLKPNKKRVTWASTMEGTTALKYIVQAGDLDIAGIYSLQAFVEIGGGRWHGQTATFEVFPLGQ